MNLQGLFDAAVKPLVAQGERSYNVDEDVCYYRHLGAKCALGHVIKDEHYHSQLENCSIEDANVQLAVALSIGQDSLTIDQHTLCSNLQDAHDSPMATGEENEWELVLEGIRAAARNFNLDFDEGEVVA